MPLNKEQPHKLTPEEVSLLGPRVRALAKDFAKQVAPIYAMSLIELADSFSGPFPELKDSSAPAVFIQLPAEAEPEVTHLLKSHPYPYTHDMFDEKAIGSFLVFTGESQDLLLWAEAREMWEAVQHAVEHDCLLMVMQAGYNYWAHLLSENTGIDERFMGEMYASNVNAQQRRKYAREPREFVFPVESRQCGTVTSQGRIEWLVNPTHFEFSS